MSETDAEVVARRLGLAEPIDQQQFIDAMQARGWGWSWSPAPEAEVIFTRPVAAPRSVREPGNDLAAWLRCARRALESEGPSPAADPHAELAGAARLVEWMRNDPLPEVRRAAGCAAQVLGEMREWLRREGTLETVEPANAPSGAGVPPESPAPVPPAW